MELLFQEFMVVFTYLPSVSFGFDDVAARSGRQREGVEVARGTQMSSDFLEKTGV